MPLDLFALVYWFDLWLGVLLVLEFWWFDLIWVVLWFLCLFVFELV